MRQVNRYKGYDNLKKLFEKFPLRVQKFKTTKWKSVQNTLLKVNKKPTFSKRSSNFEENSVINLDLKKWSKNRSINKENLAIRKGFRISLDRRIHNSNMPLKAIFKSVQIRDVLLNSSIYFEFRLDIFLWKTGIFRTAFQAHQAIKNNTILVNGKSVISDKFLNLGDVIFATKNKNDRFHKSKEMTINTDVFSSFIERDSYSNTFVVIKHLNELSNDDFRILVRGKHRIKKFRDSVI